MECETDWKWNTHLSERNKFEYIRRRIKCAPAIQFELNFALFVLYFVCNADFGSHQAAAAETKDQWNEFVNDFIGFTIDFVYWVQPNSANSFHFSSMRKHGQRTKSNINETEAAIGRWIGYSQSIPLACCSLAFNSFTFMKMYHIVVYNRRLIQFNVFVVVVVFLPTVMAKLVVKQLAFT